MALYEIRVHVEAEDEQDVDRVVADLVRAICPSRATHDHPCPRRWNIMTTQLTAGEAAELAGLLNE